MKGRALITLTLYRMRQNLCFPVRGRGKVRNHTGSERERRREGVYRGCIGRREKRQERRGCLDNEGIGKKKKERGDEWDKQR